MESNSEKFTEGYKTGLPIGLGYFAVAISLGIAARDCGFNALQGFIASIFTYASAGQYMAFGLYATNSTLLQLIILTFIINARYILMGFALNQRMPEGTSIKRRILVSTCITDEIFGVTIARPEAPDPYFTCGALIAAAPLWALGTALGITLGNFLPSRIVSALGVALFAMFIAVIVPPARKDKGVLLAIIVSFALSYASLHIPYVSAMSSGNRTILLTLLICSIFSIVLPREGGVEDEN